MDGHTHTSANSTISPSGCCPASDNASGVFGIPCYQPFMSSRNYDYERKYPPDPPGEEACDTARVWATYLDEAEIYDHDMIQSFRDTIDSLLVLAGLFSAIVATFVVQTSQAFKPDYALLSLSVQLEQLAVLRMGGNMTAISLVPSSGTAIETPTYTQADLWINCLFFTSLSLSMATALLAVLVKQWCQAYTSVISGSAKYKALIRQFRFDGLRKWKVPEIVGSLPLLLHLAFVVFFAGLACFVYDLHPGLSSTVIIIMILSLSCYLGTIVLPALWLECPYRIPMLFKPSRLLVSLFSLLRRAFGASHMASLPASLRNHLPHSLWGKARIPLSLKSSEEAAFMGSYYSSARVLAAAGSFHWLFTFSHNQSTRRVVAGALYGYLMDNWMVSETEGVYRCRVDPAPRSLKDFLNSIPTSSFAIFAFNSVVDMTGPCIRSTSYGGSLAPLKGLLDVLSYLHTAHGLPSYLPKSLISEPFYVPTRRTTIDENLSNVLLHWGVDINFDSGRALRSAAMYQATKHMAWLLDNGVPADIRPKTSWSTLMTECSLGRIDTARILIEAGADVNLVVPQAPSRDILESPLSVLVMESKPPSLDMIAFLLDNGARINQGLNSAADTVLYRAAKCGHINAVKLLLQHGANTSHEWCRSPRQIHWMNWVDEAAKYEIEGLIRAHARLRQQPNCLPTSRSPPVLSHHRLAK
ncbi:hypothetical protein DL96DRAFT_1616803 [Flagelloscypha sp. PMI_526]|nr:hypothetical protein DL96DRAFT_1616803 [Flagelloscypha sp. PMI_526]